MVTGRRAFSLIFKMALQLRCYVSFGVITSQGEERGRRYAGCLIVCPRFVVSHFATFPLCAGGGLSLIVALPLEIPRRYFHCFL